MFAIQMIQSLTGILSFLPDLINDPRLIISIIELLVSTISTVALIYLYYKLRQSQNKQNQIQEQQTKIMANQESIMEASRQADLRVEDISVEKASSHETTGEVNERVQVTIANIGEDDALDVRFYIYCEGVTDTNKEDPEEDINIKNIKEEIEFTPGIKPEYKHDTETISDAPVVPSKDKRTFLVDGFLTPGARRGIELERFITENKPERVRLVFAISFTDRLGNEEYPYMTLYESKIDSRDHYIADVIENPELILNIPAGESIIKI